MLGLAALLLAENVTRSGQNHHYSLPLALSLSAATASSASSSSSSSPPDIFGHDHQTNFTSAHSILSSSSSSSPSSWDAFVVPATSLYSDYHYSSDSSFQASNFDDESLPAHQQHQQQQPASNMATSILLSTAAFGGPWSRLLTSFIFLCTLLLLALLCFSLALVLMLAFRRLCSTYGKLSGGGSGGGGGGRRRRRKELSVLEDSSNVCLKYSPTSAPNMIPANWLATHHPPPPSVITPYSTVQQQQQQQKQHGQLPPVGKLTKASSSSQFYPAKCKEIAAITKKVRLSSMSDLTSSMHPDHIYMDIEARATTTSTRESSREPLSLPLQLPLALPFPPPRSVNNSNNNNNNIPTLAPNNSPSSPPVTATTSCFITSIEDDHQAEGEEDEEVIVVSDAARLASTTAAITEQQCTAVYGNVLQHHHHHQLHHPHPKVCYYAVSMPWYNHQQQLLHQQILQQRIRPSLNISEANLRTAKASLKAPNGRHHHHHLPLPQTLSMMDSMSAGAMMDCYSSYSEVIMELKNKFNNNNNNNKAKQNKTEESL